MKRDYDKVIESVKSELMTSNSELREIISDKDSQIKKINV